MHCNFDVPFVLTVVAEFHDAKLDALVKERVASTKTAYAVLEETMQIRSIRN